MLSQASEWFVSVKLNLRTCRVLSHHHCLTRVSCSWVRFQLCTLCFYVVSQSQGNSLSGGSGVYKVWAGLVLENAGPLRASLAGVFGKISQHGTDKSASLELIAAHHALGNMKLFALKSSPRDHKPNFSHFTSIIVIKNCVPLDTHAVNHWLWIFHESLNSFCNMWSVFRPSLHSCACMVWCGVQKAMVQKKGYVYRFPLALQSSQYIIFFLICSLNSHRPQVDSSIFIRSICRGQCLCLVLSLKETPVDTFCGLKRRLLT